jgi:hydrogenase expression/formation protein HypC
MKILKLEGDRAVVSSGKVERRIGINFLTDPRVGDYVMVHAGFAIEKVNPEKAKETLKFVEKIQ